MKELLLLRHAKASPLEAGMSDHDRPLNHRGKHDAPRMGMLIQQQQLVPDLLLSSTARRARKTADKVAAECGYTDPVRLEPSLYLAPPSAYLDLLQQLPDAHQRVLIVGHNPGLEALVEELTGRDEVLPTATLVYLRLPVTSWRDLRPDRSSTLVALWRPKELEEEDEGDEGMRG